MGVDGAATGNQALKDAPSFISCEPFSKALGRFEFGVTRPLDRHGSVDDGSSDSWAAGA